MRAFDDPVRGYPLRLILALIGVVNLPIIRFSVDWWNTLHQPTTINFTGAPSPVCRHAVAAAVRRDQHTLVFAAIVIARTRAAVMERTHPRLTDGARAE